MSLRTKLSELSPDEIRELAALILSITEPQLEGEELSERFVLTGLKDWIAQQ